MRSIVMDRGQQLVDLAETHVAFTHVNEGLPSTMRNRAAAIIQRNQKLLLMHRQKPGRDYYILPGGGVEFEESFQEACIREVKEETGLDVLGLRLVYIFHLNGSEERYFVVRVSTDGEPVLGGSEAKRHSTTNAYSFEWVDFEQLKRINLQPAAAHRICLEILGGDPSLPGGF